MRELIKTIQGQDCEVFAIHHHDRIQVGKAVPKIEVYEESMEVPTLGSNRIRYKNTLFSIVICPDPEMDAAITTETLRNITAFDLRMMLPRKDDVYVPFMICGVYNADLEPDEWVFQISDKETVSRLLGL